MERITKKPDFTAFQAHCYSPAPNRRWIKLETAQFSRRAGPEDRSSSGREYGPPFHGMSNYPLNIDLFELLWPRYLVKVTFDSTKRVRTLKERDLDFAPAGEVFEGLTFTQRDERRDYGEVRFQTYGVLDRRLVMIVWTHRFEAPPQ